MKHRLVVIPTYNESLSLPPLLEQIFEKIYGCEILVVDDGSPDSTAAICRSMQDRYPNLHVLERKEKSGIGSAYRAGFAWGLEKGFDEFIEMDDESGQAPAPSKEPRKPKASLKKPMVKKRPAAGASDAE